MSREIDQRSCVFKLIALLESKYEKYESDILVPLEIQSIEKILSIRLGYGL